MKAAHDHTEKSTAVRVWESVIDRATCREAIECLAAGTEVPGGVLRAGREVPDARLRNCSERAAAGEQVASISAAMREVAVEMLAALSAPRAGWDGPKFCTYGPGGFFRAHVDRSEDPLDPPVIRARRLTVVAVLNDGNPADDLPVYDGGALVVHAPAANGHVVPATLTPAAGSIVVFRSDLLHEVRPVRSGVRFAAIGWLYDVSDPEEGA